MFSIGDLVVHPMHGAGMIEGIVREKIAGVAQDYYVFKMPVGGLLLKIPVANSETIGIRTIMSQADAEQLLAAIPGMEVETNANWNKRYRENMARMKSGDLYEVARVIKALMHREKQRGLSNGERKMLHNARQILISEVVMAENADYAELEKRVDAAMLRTPEAKSD
ncbi:MAG: CarD family transcriptional regulator [Oscillibacter sp.]|nr:CarD family transcriptional regulator [Oscillibacter sp.]